MSYIHQNITPDERVIAVSKLHWVIFARPFFWLLITLLCLSVGSYYSLLQFQLLPIIPPLYKALAFITLCVTILFTLSTYVHYFTTEFAITNKRVVIKSGLLRRTTREMLLNRIESISTDQSLFGRMLNYGSLLISGVGGSWEPLPLLPNPSHLRSVMQTHMEGSSHLSAGI